MDFGDDKTNKIRNFICPGSFYVAITRVRKGTKLFLKSFEKSYILANKEIRAKIESMRKIKPYLKKKIYLDEEIFTVSESEVKIGFLNVNGINSKSHSHYLNHDHNLKNLHLLALAETKLEEKFNTDRLTEDLSEWKIVGRYDATDGPHMGILLLSNVANSFQVESVTYKSARRNTSLQIQGIIVRLEMGLKIGFLYCRSTPTIKEIEAIKKEFSECTVLLGDLNLSHRVTEEKKKIDMLCEPSRFNSLTEITRTESNNQLDYIILHKKFRDSYFSTSYFNFISDHKAITVRLPLSERSTLKNSIKEKITFDCEVHLKKKKNDDVEEMVISEDHYSSSGDELNDSKGDNEIMLRGKQPQDNEMRQFKRRFQNDDMATCWLNSCLQLVLLALDYCSDFELYSELGCELLSLHSTSSSNSDGLNPTNVKNILVAADDTRIALRLSEVSMEAHDGINLEAQLESIRRMRLDLLRGQQCIRDFFVCLSQSKDQWADVCSLFEFNMSSMTVCGKCSYISKSATQYMYHEISIPRGTSELSKFLPKYFNDGIMVQNKCDNCKQTSLSVHRDTLTDSNTTEMILIILTRTMQTNDCICELLKSKVNPTGDVLIR